MAAAEGDGESLELATRTRSRKNMVKAWRLRAEIALARRDLDGAEGALHEALVVASAIGNPTQLWKTHAAWGRLHAARQHPDAACEPTGPPAPSSSASRRVCAIRGSARARRKRRPSGR
jgi:hypothetical protein